MVKSRILSAIFKLINSLEKFIGKASWEKTLLDTNTGSIELSVSESVDVCIKKLKTTLLCKVLSLAFGSKYLLALLSLECFCVNRFQAQRLPYIPSALKLKFCYILHKQCVNIQGVSRL
jgi:hypothetical protein